MTRKLWAALIAFFLAVSAGSAIYLYLSLSKTSLKDILLKQTASEPQQPKPEDLAPKLDISTATKKAEPTAAQSKNEPVYSVPAKIDKKLSSRNILFIYHNSRAKKVSLIGDFNEWTRQPLAKKGKGKNWKITEKLAPGTYQYQFVVDGKKIPDPNNKKISNEGKSIIVIQPPETK